MMKEFEKKNIIRSVFIRNGGPGIRTFFFENAPPEVQKQITLLVEIEPPELPVLISYKDLSQWTFISTRKIAHTIDHNVAYILPKNIDSINENIIVTLGHRARHKKNLNTLKIKTKESQEYFVYVESGPPYSAIWNVIRFMAGSKNFT